MSRPQVHGYVTPAERDAFQFYAQGLGLDITALANLLIARELRLRRLSSLVNGDVAAEGPSTPASCLVKITAHVPLAATKAAFIACAAACGLKPTPAATLLFRTELRERWLEREVLVNQFDSD